jgi:hypothetical protein
VVARGNDGNAGAQKVDRNFSGNSAAASRVFAIYYNEIDPVLCLEFREPGNDGVAAGFADDVTEKKNL